MKVAAVLVPIYRGPDRELRLVLVRRTSYGIHGGQIAFPGGTRISCDGTLVDTAKRETEEEIGIPAGSMKILEHLPVIETRSTGFRIHPFLARIVPPKTWKPDPREIAEVLEVRVKDLSLPENRGRETRTVHVGQERKKTVRRRISFFRVGSHKLWGATYRILDPLVARLVSGEWRV